MIGGFNKLHNLPPAVLWSVLVVVIVGIGVGGFFLFNDYIYNEKQGENQNSAIQVAPGSSPDETVEPNDVTAWEVNSNFSAPKNLRVLYVYRRFAPEENIAYSSLLNGADRQAVSLPAFTEGREGYQYLYFDNFDYLIQTNTINEDITLFALDDLTQSKTIVTIQEEYTYLGSVFPIDKDRIIYYESRETEPGQHEFGGPRENSIYVVNVDGSGQRLIYQYTQDRDSWPSFQTYDSTTDEVLLTEAGGGGCNGNFKALNLSTGALRIIETQISDADVCSLAFSEDRMLGYYKEGLTKIVQYNFSTNSKKILYEIGEGFDSHSNSSYVSGPFLSPDYLKIAFTERLEPSNKEITKVIELSTGEVTTVVDDERYYNVGVDSWAPDSEHLWLDTNCHGCGGESGYDNEGEYYIVDISSGDITLFFKGEAGTYDETGQGVRVNEHLSLLGWLVE